jgi:predicted ArsR family transcriptional regulator
MKTTDLFKNTRSAERLNEGLQKTFGKRLNLESFDLPKLEDARNKLRTQIHDARSQSGFNENIENEALTQAQWMLDAINAEIAEREEFISDPSVAEIEEGRSPEVEEFLTKVANDPQAGYDMLYDAQMGKFGKEIERVIQDMYDDVTIDTGYHGDDDFEQIYDRMLDNIESDYADKDVKEGAMSEIAIELAQVADDEDYDKLYDLLSDPGPVGQYLQDKIDEITFETGLHPKDDIEKIEPMLMDIIQQEFGGQNDDEGGETDDNYAMASAGFGSDEDYESINNESVKTGDDMTKLQEGEIQQASAIVTAKTMVDRVGRWIEELSGMENDTLLQLGDSIRDEMGSEQAKNFISAVAPAIQAALENLKATRETLSTGVRTLTGEEQPANMLGDEPEAGGMDDLEAPAEPDMMNAEPEGDIGDEFAAADAAAGGVGDAGRAQRESIDRQNSLLRVLAG